MLCSSSLINNYNKSDTISYSYREFTFIGFFIPFLAMIVIQFSMLVF